MDFIVKTLVFKSVVAMLLYSGAVAFALRPSDYENCTKMLSKVRIHLKGDAAKNGGVNKSKIMKTKNVVILPKTTAVVCLSNLNQY